MNTEATQDHQEANTTGARLRHAREQLGLSQQAVAERLCLKVSTVRDIEDDKAPADLASTFLRGYIRSYARLVHIPEDELLPMMAKQAPIRAAKVAPMQSFSLGKRRKKRDGWLMSFTWLVLFVVIGLSGAWWWQDHKAQQEEISTMADQSSAELNGGDANSQNVPLDTSAPAAPTADSAANSAPTIPPTNPARPLKGMQLCHKALYAPGKTKRNLLFGAMKTAGQYDKFHGLVMSEEPNPKCREYCLLLNKLYEGAIPVAVDLIMKYQNYLLGTGDLPKRFHCTFGAGDKWEELVL